jgi:hypothetical protein
VIAAVIALVGFLLLRIIQARQGSKNLPPGPPAWPLVGENCADDMRRSTEPVTDHQCVHRQPATNPNIESISPVSDGQSSISPKETRLRTIRRLAEWSRTYGPIIGLKMGSQDLIVLNTASAVHEQVSPSSSVMLVPCMSDR